jgi:hypothetical protein
MPRFDRLLGLGAVAVAAEPSTQVAHVQVDVLLGDSGYLCGAKPRFLGALITDPDVDPIAGDEHGSVARLHARARQIRRRVGRLDDFGGARKGRVDIALIGTHVAGPIERSQQGRAHGRCGDRGELRRDLPFDRHAIERGLGLVPGVGDDGDAAAEDAAAGQRGIRNRELHGRAHAGQRANRVEVVAPDITAIDGTCLHGRPFHAGYTDVDRVHRLTRHL